jgi:uridine phosphorylase
MCRIAHIVCFLFALLIQITLCKKLPKEECTIIKNPNPIPPVGVICANPERAKLIATSYFDYFFIHTDFRGYKIYVGEYQGVPLFSAYIGLGSASAAFMVEELVANDARVIVRLGTNDYNTTEADANNVYVVDKCLGLEGLMRDYGYEQSQWGKALHADASLFNSLVETAKEEQFKQLNIKKSTDYNIDAFYSFFDPNNVAANPENVRGYIKEYQQEGATVRDMETCAVLLIGEMRKEHVRTGSVLQAVVKHGASHEDVGTKGINLVLQTLKKEALKFPAENKLFLDAHKQLTFLQ